MTFTAVKKVESGIMKRLIVSLFFMCFPWGHVATAQNRLASESSPYLLQHADNPVWWMPWSDSAFDQAKKEDKPVFLSIGYASCHWCHVMERESFSSPEVARILNESFISIKVDREEHPAIDEMYMAACRLMTENCGWPLTILATPDREPFFAGTYLSNKSAFGRIGLLDLLPQYARAWKSGRLRMESSADMILSAVRAEQDTAGSIGPTDEQVIETAYEQLVQTFDEENGGFGEAPKFPDAGKLTFLLEYGDRTGNQKAWMMVEKTLRDIRSSALFDQVGFGFHRYASDASWTQPHFEKMLVDQALLSLTYLDAWKALRDPLFRRTTEETLDFAIETFGHQDGAFYTSLDAESDEENGSYYLWTLDELNAALDSDSASPAVKAGFDIVRRLGASAAGNFRDELSGELTGKNVVSAEVDLLDDRRWADIRNRLLIARSSRTPPRLDDKILTDWNGLMVVALARSGAALNRTDYINAAERAAEFLLSHLTRPDGGLWHSWRNGVAGVEAMASDYVNLVWGLTELYEATFDVRYLEQAIELNQFLTAHFTDEGKGGVFLTARENSRVPIRQFLVKDDSAPSPNSVHFANLLRLYRLTAEPAFEIQASALDRTVSGLVTRFPSAHPYFLSGLMSAFGPAFEVVIVGERGDEATEAMLAELWSGYYPNKVMLFRPAGILEPLIAEIAPFTQTQRAIGGEATAYVCQGFVCRLPTTDIQEMKSLLDPSRAIQRE